MNTMELTDQQLWEFDCKGFVNCASSSPSPTSTAQNMAGDCLIMHHAIQHTALPNISDRDRINIQYLTSPNWIRSKDAERLSSEYLEQMPEEHRERILSSKW